MEYKYVLSTLQELVMVACMDKPTPYSYKYLLIQELVGGEGLVESYYTSTGMGTA